MYLNQKSSQWIKNTIYCLQETHIKYKNSETLKVKGWKKYVMEELNAKERIYIKISSKLDFKVRNTIKDKEGTFYNDKGVSCSGRCKNSKFNIK